MIRRRNSEPVPTRRKLTIMESAMFKREQQVPITERFDPVRYIEHTLPKVIKDFDYDYFNEHPFFMERPDRYAFVDFTDGVQLYVREQVVDAAYRGDNEARFALAHEIGHVFLHRKKAASILSRHKVGSAHQYAGDKVLEFEANLFGGTLLAPPSGISELMSVFEVRRKFQCSHEVAERAIQDAKLWRKQRR